MGEVYRATDPTLHRTVAIKTVRPDIHNPDGSYLERLYREAQAVAQLQHPNIVTVFEAAEADGLVYIAMEYVKGESLGAALQRGDLLFETKIKIVSQILDALQYAHGEGVVHRDIKPANVHLLPGGSIKLLDFGLAYVARAESLTATGLAMGTPFYALPEQLKGEEVDGRTDIYATGVLTYELLTGRRAFDGETLSAVIAKVLSNPPPPMGTSLSAAFPEIDRILARAMAKNAADRYATADDMRNALAAFMANAREGLAAIYATQVITAQKAVLEARTLIDSGRIEQAEALLAETLRTNPEAVAVRALLKDTSSVRRARSAPPSRPQVPARRSSPEFSASESGPSGQPTVLLPTDAPLRRRVLRRRQRSLSHHRRPWRLNRNRSVPVPAPPSRTFLWAGLAAAVAIVAVAAWTLTGNRTAPETPPAVADAPQTSPTPQSTPQPAQPSVAAPTPAAVTPAERPPAAARGGASTAAPAVPAPESTPAAAAPAPVEAAGAAAANASAKKMYGDAASHALGLKYGILRQTPDGGESEVDPAGTTFHSGDKIRFTFESNGDGYLYLVQEGSSGKWTVLFPNPDINGGVNAVKRLQKYTIPSRGWFVFNEIPGIDRAFVFLSREPLDQLPGFNQPVTRMESVASSIVENLRRSVRARDLLFEREQVAGSSSGKSASTFVVNRDELGRSVAASIELLHQQ